MSGLLLATTATTTNLSGHLISIRSAIEASELAGPEVAAGPSNNVIQSDDQLVFGASQAAQMGLSDAPAEASTWAQLMAALFVDQQPGQQQQQQPGGWWQPNWLNLLLAAFLVLLMLTTAVGNLFVIVAILIERNLRTIGNYLVLSLAIADLLVALLVMPLAGIYQILDRWTLGVLLCDIWTSADVFCCTASILHLLAIALDRYWAVTRVDYIRCQRNERRILAMILFVWAAACVISLAPVFGWKDAQFEWRITQAKECLISQDVGYQIFATFTTFYFPLILTLIFYWKIYQVARKRIRRKLDNRLVKVNLQHPSKFPSTSNAPAATLMAAKGTGSPAAKTNKLCQCPCHHDELRAKMMTDKKRRDVDSSHSHPPGKPGAEEPNGPNGASSDGGQSKCNKSNHNGNGNDNDIKPTRRDNVGDDKTSTQPAGQSKEQTAQAAHTEHIATFASCSRSSSARSASSSSGSSSGSSLVIGERRKLKKCARPQPLSRHSHHCRASLGAKLDECPGCLCGTQFANRDELVGGEPNCCPTTRGQHREQQQVAHKRQDSLGDSNSSNLSQLSSSLMANSRPEGQQQQKQQHASLGRQSSEACDECCAACCCHGQTNMTATDLGPISQSAPTQTASTSQQQQPPPEDDADKNGPQLELESNEKNPTRTAIKQDSLVSVNQRGQVCCDIVVVDEQTDEPGRPLDRPADAPKETTLLVTLGLHLVGWLRRLAPSNWRQLMSRTTTTDEQNKPTAIPNCTILVDERGQSSLVPAGQANGDAATDTCRQCKCPLGMDNHEGAQRHLTHNAFSLDEAEIQRASSSARQAGGMVIAVSTANIAVTTSVREPKSTATTTTTNQIGQQPTSTSAVQQSIEGVESKRERKAAKTLAIITGVFVMCWLPFFVMAITMPLLQLRPHKYVFAFLLWLGYANSMLNPIIYTIFSPDFRKAFNRLLCGLEDETPGKNRASKRHRIAASKRHNNNNSLAADWDQPDDHHESGYLAQVRHQLARIHPILAKLTCCCCCCCCYCCCPSKTTGSSWSSGSPPVSTSQQASRFQPKGARLAANDTKGSPQHLLLANNLHNSFEGSRGTTMDTTTGSMRTNSSSAGPTPVRQRPPVGPTTPTTQQATRPLLATRPFSSITNDF